MPIKKIKKRDGRVVKFNPEKIENAIWAAVQSVGGKDRKRVKVLTEMIVKVLEEKTSSKEIPTVEQVQDLVEKILIEKGHAKVAKAYILYRKQHKDIREVKGLLEDIGLVEDYLDRSDWRVRENANMSYSLQGLNVHIVEKVISRYWLNKIYSPEVKKAHLEGDFHVHDLGTLGCYCVGWDLKDLLTVGLKGVRGKIESKPARHFQVALLQVINFMYTLQGEVAGAIAFSNFDTLLAPFIRYDGLDYSQVKQSMQEFLFNMNVPTRVGFQCLSEDTEILTPNGWQSYDEVKKGDIIKTFNPEKKVIENKEVKKVFRREYNGEMYNVKNRIQNQLLSPGHRMVRRKFNTDKICLEEVEKVKELDSPPIIPIAADNENKEIDLTDEQIKLIAWVISEGSLETKGSWKRITIYQSKEKSKETYEEIISILKGLDMDYTIQEGSKSLGAPVAQIRFNADDSRKILELFDKDDDVKHIPRDMLEMSQRQSKIFLETYIKGDGHEDCKITVSDEDILTSLQHIVVNAGYGFTVWQRKATGVGNKMLYILRIIRHQETYIQEIEEVDYKGVIWSINTDNETVVAKRRGKVFITGNTPFTNVTLDLQAPSYMKKEPIIIGGEAQDETYGEFQEEQDMFNRAFAEVILEGDAKGRPFTFPIPTYNLTKDFDWEDGPLKPVWEMTAKYGIPYFANFINADMKPDDARSMCCRLRLDKRELKKRGGGLFGSNPLTGSIGVMTINLPRIGYLAESKKDYFERLEGLMDLARKALQVKRETLERLTKEGLYPYSKFYLRNIKKGFGEYWKNHFSTIGIIGMNESLLNFMDKTTAEPKGIEFASEILDFMREKLADYQASNSDIYNLEATPAEGASYRLARLDKEKYPELKIHNQEVHKIAKSKAPYYTNSTHLPVNYTQDIFEALDLQDDLQTKYTGGTVLHGFLGEKMPSVKSTKALVKKIAENYALPYFTLTPSFSICPVCGYLPGEQELCPRCLEDGKEQKTEIYSRVVGYLRPVEQWNDGKQAEFGDRKTYDKQLKNREHKEDTEN